MFNTLKLIFFGTMPKKQPKPAKHAKYRITRRLTGEGLYFYDVEEWVKSTVAPRFDHWVLRFGFLDTETQAREMLQKLKEHNRQKNVEEFFE